jgi:hypothetical protein
VIGLSERAVTAFAEACRLAAQSGEQVEQSLDRLHRSAIGSDETLTVLSGAFTLLKRAQQHIAMPQAPIAETHSSRTIVPLGGHN